jgi:beta-N-acetylhexosaminidase
MAAVLVLVPTFGRGGQSGSPFWANDWAAQTLSSLSLREKIGQLVHIRVQGRFLNHHSQEFTDLRDQIRRNRVGGLILFAGNVYESAVLLNDLQRESKLPLIVSADFERGAAFRISDATSFPWTMALGAAGSEDLAYQEGVVTGREARALGVHWVYAPVLDVNNNPDNPVINIRSYGEDPKLVARLGAAFIRGCREQGVLTTAKHFPGHGDTATDSHIGLPVVGSDASRLDAVELVPFRSAIAAGVDAVMTAHVAVPHITGASDVPATLSARVLGGLLRERLGFQGIVVTDALEMGAITTRTWSGKAAVRALAAGADILLLPPNNDVAIDEVERAVRRGELSEERISRSAAKVLEAKARLGLDRDRFSTLERIAETVASPESQRLAAEIAERSVTLVRDQDHVLPINPIRPPRICSIAISSELDSSPAGVFQTELRRRYPNARTAALDTRAPDDMVASVLKSAAEAEVVVVATVVRVVTGRGNVALPEVQRALLGKLFALGKPVVWVTFGNPYLLRHYPRARTYLCTFSYADVSQAAAARALAGEIAIDGKMPVSIPDLTPVGAGIRVAKLEMTLRTATPESKGLRAGAFRKVEQMIEVQRAKGVLSAAALAVAYRGGLVEEVLPNGRFEAASLIRPLVLAPAAWLLSDGGHLLLDAPAADYVAESRDTRAVRALLEQSDPAAMALLAEVVGRAAGRSVETLVETALFRPLGMTSTSYAGGKLTTSARDLTVFGQMLVNGGLYDHRRFFRRETVARFAPWKGEQSPLAVFSGKGAMVVVEPERNLVMAFLAKDGRPGVAEVEKAVAAAVTDTLPAR